MQDEILDFYNMLVVRNQLLTLDTKTLEGLYDEENAYLTFLDSLGTLFNNDGGFLLLDENISHKIFSVIQLHRFDIDLPGLNDYINDLIVHVNQYKSFTDPVKDEIDKDYFVFNEMVREKIFKNQDELKMSLTMDAAVFVALNGDRLDIIKNFDYGLASLNYIMKCIPEFFKNEEINTRAGQLLDMIDTNTRTLSIRKLKVKSAKKNYLEMNT